jgi:hypothetical protein
MELNAVNIVNHVKAAQLAGDGFEEMYWGMVFVETRGQRWQGLGTYVVLNI